MTLAWTRKDTRSARRQARSLPFFGIAVLSLQAFVASQPGSSESRGSERRIINRHHVEAN